MNKQTLKTAAITIGILWVINQIPDVKNAFYGKRSFFG